jgi:hypothetical protein
MLDEFLERSEQKFDAATAVVFETGIARIRASLPRFTVNAIFGDSATTAITVNPLSHEAIIP